MAIIYRAELSPTKTEMLRDLLHTRSWGEPEDRGELEVIGAYRFDDPDGEVGIECHLVRVGETVYHLPLTYRGAPLQDGEALVGTMDHSVLGQRYVYDGLGDETALSCFLRALQGEQEQAVLEIVDDDDGAVAEIRPQSITVRRDVDADVADAETSSQEAEEVTFTVARTLGDLDGSVRLVASWDSGEGVIAAL